MLIFARKTNVFIICRTHPYVRQAKRKLYRNYRGNNSAARNRIEREVSKEINANVEHPTSNFERRSKRAGGESYAAAAEAPAV
jgi:hypothetical protein